MINPIRFAIPLVFACAAGCSSPGASLQTIMNLPAPATEADRQEQCSSIRSEIARQQSAPALAAMGGGNLAMFQAASAKNVAMLEGRASAIHCEAAFSNAPAPASSAIDQCISACKANTARSPEQCFDDCR